jgi:hypothetical protein
VIVDSGRLYVLPSSEASIDADLREVDSAIEMVTRGAAVRVRLVGLQAAEEIAPIALARAQAAGVQFALDRRATTRLTIGPRD